MIESEVLAMSRAVMNNEPSCISLSLLRRLDGAATNYDIVE